MVSSTLTQGCCLSNSADPNSPYSADAASGSVGHINHTLSLSEASLPASRPRPHRRRRRDDRPLDQHIDKPLRLHRWTSKDQHWTLQALDAERVAFETRVSGRAEIWQAIHAALQVLWTSEREDRGEEDMPLAIATAQSILSAAEISLPIGDLANGAYDSLGSYYQIPPWIASDPTNLDHDEPIDAKTEPFAADEETVQENDALTVDDLDRREEKGKGILSPQEVISIRARLSDTGQDITLAVDKTDTVQTILRSATEQSGLPSNKKIRLAYMGRILQNHLSRRRVGKQVMLSTLVFDR